MASTVGLKLDETLKARLKSLGQMRDRSPHWLMREAIVKYLQVEETFEAEKRDDHERWERYVLTGENVPNTEVSAWLSRTTKITPKKIRR